MKTKTFIASLIVSACYGASVMVVVFIKKGFIPPIGEVPAPWNVITGISALLATAGTFALALGFAFLVFGVLLQGIPKTYTVLKENLNETI